MKILRNILFLLLPLILIVFIISLFTDSIVVDAVLVSMLSISILGDIVDHYVIRHLIKSDTVQTILASEIGKSNRKVQRIIIVGWILLTAISLAYFPKSIISGIVNIWIASKVVFSNRGIYFFYDDNGIWFFKHFQKNIPFESIINYRISSGRIIVKTEKGNVKLPVYDASASEEIFDLFEKIKIPQQ